MKGTTRVEDRQTRECGASGRLRYGAEEWLARGRANGVAPASEPWKALIGQALDGTDARMGGDLRGTLSGEEAVQGGSSEHEDEAEARLEAERPRCLSICARTARRSFVVNAPVVPVVLRRHRC
jgi:hypothetical protein